MPLFNSTARALLATTLAAALFAGTGCSWMHRKDGSLKFVPHRQNSDYAQSRENRPLEVPPDLDTPATDPTMQIPAVHGSTSAAVPTNGNPSFTMTDSVGGSWERIGRALDRTTGVTVTQRSQLINSYEVQYKGATMLLRATSEGAQATRVDAVGADGQPIRSPEAVELLRLLRDRIG